ncbi:DpnII family type II restriction endonuclease [Adlercreutzia sp. ZJ473]|uniref:DpnII family type II restriction endonuclease n=1 Tax=Adlercreutzia sp. ZJ473 TaxID=2722822 RepID=UPI001558154E|nr:type I restriction enzyme HsdR N-terminal domain-containing protein [Adlercreutzia sp. ZJ473]
MAVYQDKAKERIKKGLRRMSGIVERGIRDEYKEADTRKIVSDMLCEQLGWDKFENVTAEQMIGSRYADYVVKTDQEAVFVVEVKQIGLKLKETHLNQARQYAVDEGIDWIILTNGDEWQAYRTSLEGKIPVTKHVFTVRISDKNMKPAEKVDLLYLFSEEANRKHEIEDYYQRRIALSGENLADHILSDDVINKLRISLKNGTGQKLSNSEIAQALIDRLFRPEKTTDDHRRAIRKMQRSERQKSKIKTDGESSKS